jgi:hypothetical protein
MIIFMIFITMRCTNYCCIVYVYDFCFFIKIKRWIFPEKVDTANSNFLIS